MKLSTDEFLMACFIEHYMNERIRCAIEYIVEDYFLIQPSKEPTLRIPANSVHYLIMKGFLKSKEVFDEQGRGVCFVWRLFDTL